MRLAILLAACLFLSGCPKRVQPRFPVIETRPPQYIWVCNTHADGTIVCDAVASEKDIPPGYQCVQQDNGVEVCWQEMTLPREQK